MVIFREPVIGLSFVFSTLASIVGIVLIVRSPFLRAIVVETLAHPFRRAQVVEHEGEIQLEAQ